jgi:hypothetical protein
MKHFIFLLLLSTTLFAKADRLPTYQHQLFLSANVVAIATITSVDSAFITIEISKWKWYKIGKQKNTSFIQIKNPNPDNGPTLKHYNYNILQAGKRWILPLIENNGTFEFVNTLDYGIQIAADSIMYCFSNSPYKIVPTKKIDDVFEAITLLKKRYAIKPKQYLITKLEQNNTPFKNEIAEMWRQECELLLNVTTK